MKAKPRTSIPLLLSSGIIAFVCLVEILGLPFFHKLEWLTYDWRVRQAQSFSPPVSTNLGCVYLDDRTIQTINQGYLGNSYGLYWPRHVYGRLVRELNRQGATAVALDIIFAERRSDHAPVMISSEPLELQESDEFFADRMREAGNVILAASDAIVPPPLFLTNALAVGDISSHKDSDGVLRRARAFQDYHRTWHPLFLQLAREYGVVLERTVFEPRRMTLYQSDGNSIEVPLTEEGLFDLVDFVGEEIPPGMERYNKPFEEGRIWQMGIVLAAQALKLDLINPDIDLAAGVITFKGPGGLVRKLPVDRDGYFMIDWSIPSGSEDLAQGRFEELARAGLMVEGGTGADRSVGGAPKWKDKLVVVGSKATGNDLTDAGATPLEESAFLMSKHWNIANSFLQDRFVKQMPLGGRLGLILVLGSITALLSSRLRALAGSMSVLLIIVAWTAITMAAYVKYRYWMPLALPVLGSLLTTHVALITFRFRVEQTERTRIRSIFSKMVSPSIVNELLDTERLALAGERRELTILFADIRRFTEVTDETQARAEALARERGLGSAETEEWLDQQARDILNTVNLYLATVADMVKKHNGTLDKYIGDCVMAFWGAPTPNEKHSRDCVLAGIDAQRAIARLNSLRAGENRRREIENQEREARGELPLPLLPILQIGTGINTGMVTVGLMGSEEHSFNYTVFGREVNLASRLEGASGYGRILIGAATYEHLRRCDPALAEKCRSLPPISIKGFREMVSLFEVPWAEPGSE